MCPVTSSNSSKGAPSVSDSIAVSRFSYGTCLDSFRSSS